MLLKFATSSLLSFTKPTLKIENIFGENIWNKGILNHSLPHLLLNQHRPTFSDLTGLQKQHYHRLFNVYRHLKLFQPHQQDHIHSLNHLVATWKPNGHHLATQMGTFGYHLG